MNIYRLRRAFGRDITLFKFMSETSNLTTGRKDRAYMVYHIHKAIVMSAIDARQLVSEFWKESSSSLLVLETTIELTANDHCEFDSKRYTFKTITKIEGMYMIAIEDSGLPLIGISINDAEKINLNQDCAFSIDNVVAPLSATGSESLRDIDQIAHIEYIHGGVNAVP